MKIEQYYLVFACGAVSVIALLHGVSPSRFARTFPGVSDLDADLAHILRPMTGLCLGFGLFRLFAALHDGYRDAAALTTVIFCGGLVSGRLASPFAGGRPAPLPVLHVFVEFALVPIGYWVFRLPE